MSAGKLNVRKLFFHFLVNGAVLVLVSVGPPFAPIGVAVFWAAILRSLVSYLLLYTLNRLVNKDPTTEGLRPLSLPEVWRSAYTYWADTALDVVIAFALFNTGYLFTAACYIVHIFIYRDARVLWITYHEKLLKLREKETNS